MPVSNWRVDVGIRLLGRRSGARELLDASEVRAVRQEVRALLARYDRTYKYVSRGKGGHGLPQVDPLVEAMRRALADYCDDPELSRRVVKAIALNLAAGPVFAQDVLASAGVCSRARSLVEAYEPLGRRGAEAVAVAAQAAESPFGGWSPRPSLWPILRGFRPPPSTPEPQRPDDHLHRWLAGRHGDHFSVTR